MMENRPTERIERQRQLPLSVYRLQLHRDFGFRAATEALPYLAALGVGGVYCSPILRARPGSRHGYDICNHEELNPDLGSEDEFSTFCATLRTLGLLLLLDIIPNHMAADPDANGWWRDVLEHGPSSSYAHYFDIDWAPLKRELRGKLLLPVLGDHYGAVLERGELRLCYQDAALLIAYGAMTFPLDLRSVGDLLRVPSVDLNLNEESNATVRELLSIATGCERLPSGSSHDREAVAERRRESGVLRERLARLVQMDSAAASHLSAALAQYNGVLGSPESFDSLHTLLEAQHYRLASWKTASHEINYRRFFDVNELAGVRVEAADVFEATHRRVLALLRSGTVAALRLDHIDGLFDPHAYLTRLQQSYSDSIPVDGSGDAPAALSDELRARPAVLYVEKILAANESLCADWPIEGTTGYDFLNEVNGLFVSDVGLAALTRAYRAYSNDESHRSLAAATYDCKKLIMTTSLAAELRVLADALNRISESDRHSRDFTLEALRDAIVEFVACLPCYRTYCADGPPSSWDVGVIHTTLRVAARKNPAMERSIFEFLRSILLSDAPPDDPRKRFVMKLQQYSGPVQAKGVEDTVFYRHNALASLNEVGADYHRRTVGPAEFHRLALARQRHWPNTLITTSTHDTKRGEDLRMRLNVLSELPEEWSGIVAEWSELHRPLCEVIDGELAPSAADRQLLYQIIVGIWPISWATAGQVSEELIGRLKQYMQKATREAKVTTSWISPNESYDAAVERFVEALFRGGTADRFLESLFPFVERIAPSGFVNSLAQLLLKLTAPGIPDIYQGTELWDFTLVDPDNRRPVQYDLRAGALGTLEFEDRSASQAVTLLTRFGDGRLKLFLMRCALELRKSLPQVFRLGSYLPIECRGSGADHIVAFVRSVGEDAVLVVVPRCVARQLSPARPFPIGVDVWGDTQIELPPQLRTRGLTNVLTGAALGAGETSVAVLLRELPIGLLRST